MIVLGIDPGTEKSGTAVFNTDDHALITVHEYSNGLLLQSLREPDWRPGGIIRPDVLVIEDVTGMGFSVGKEVFDTCKWIGRFMEAWERRIPMYPYSPSNDRAVAVLISRGDVKTVLCGGQTYVDPTSGKRRGFKDAEIRKILIDFFSPTGAGRIPQIGTTKNPGPLFRVKGHCWQALAVCYTYYLTLQSKEAKRTKRAKVQG